MFFRVWAFAILRNIWPNSASLSIFSMIELRPLLNTWACLRNSFEYLKALFGR
jgi:hypothetical protein